jgi:hypothetical protein
MNIPDIFLDQLWKLLPSFCAVAPLMSIGFLVLRFLTNNCLLFLVHPQSFPELAAFTEDEQQRLLSDASMEAFSALSFVPMLVLFATFWVGFALIETLKKVTALPVWVLMVLFGLFLGLAGWLGGRTEVHRVRPFLKKLIDGQTGKTVA